MEFTNTSADISLTALAVFCNMIHNVFPSFFNTFAFILSSPDVTVTLFTVIPSTA